MDAHIRLKNVYILQETFGTRVHMFDLQKKEMKQKQGFGNQNSRDEEFELFQVLKVCVLYFHS